jgi:hypothetical protein
MNDAWIWHEWLTTKPGLDAITSYCIDGKELYFRPEKQSTHYPPFAKLSSIGGAA